MKVPNGPLHCHTCSVDSGYNGQHSILSHHTSRSVNGASFHTALNICGGSTSFFSYISFCEDMCIPTRTHLTYNNNKPWFTAKLRQFHQVKELRSWMSGAVLTFWSWTCSKLWRSSWTSGEIPLLSPTHHHEQHCDCSGVIQVPVHHHHSGHEVEKSHWVHFEKGPAEVVLPSPAEKVQPATGAAKTVLLCHN